MPRPLHVADPVYAQQVATRRRQARLSQHALGQRCGFTESVICRMETGRTPIPPDRRALLDAALALAERDPAILAGVR